jgi:small subunit ribosomal protein S16
MVKIRLKRLGRKGKPFYRVVVTDIRNRRDGVPMAELGFYNPITKELKLDKTTALAWIAKGDVPSETAKKLIDKASDSGELIVLEKRAPKPKAAPVVEAPAVEAEAPVAVAAAVAAPEAAAPAEVETPEAASEEVPAAEA